MLDRLAISSRYYPQWESYNFYRVGAKIMYKNPVTNLESYWVCLTDHTSSFFEEDSALDGFWSEITETVQTRKSPLNGCFHVIHPTVTNQHIVEADLTSSEVEFESLSGITGSTLEIQWKDFTGTNFLFPQFSTLNVTSMETAPYAYAQRQFQHHFLTFEIEYITTRV
jgi:hypothetical protein